MKVKSITKIEKNEQFDLTTETQNFFVLLKDNCYVLVHNSPSIVFGHHPKTGKFFVASKSAFNKNPKINYTEKDIDRNHGHAPGLSSKLKSALKHFPKVTPKKGIYQGDLMYTHEDLKHE